MKSIPILIPITKIPLILSKTAILLLLLSLQSCLTLCDPIDGSPPGSTALGILQAGTLEWVAISFCNAWKWKVKVKSLSCVWLFATPWAAAYQAPLSMGFSRQEYWSGLPLPSPKQQWQFSKRKFFKNHKLQQPLLFPQSNCFILLNYKSQLRKSIPEWNLSSFFFTISNI